jgi:TM2 domain-containing membrane protein YozV
MTETRTATPHEKFCADCGQIINLKAELCPHCGVRQMSVAPSTNKSRTTAAIYALFLGGVGGHKFYLGRPGAGFLYMCFVWTFIPSCLAFFDFILLLAMSDNEFASKYANA